MSERPEFHPLADLIPPMTEAEYEDLKADIKANGLLMPIVLFEGKVLDGRHRLRACREVDLEPRFTEGDDWISNPAAFVLSANIHRRHLDAKQKRDVIEALLKASPEKSDRQIAEMTKSSPTTVGAVRREMESTVQSGQLPPKRIGKDGKARKWPAKKKPKDVIVQSAGKTHGEVHAEAVAAMTAAPTTADDNRLAEKLRAAEIKIAGLESEVELKAENARLRAELEAKQETATEPWCPSVDVVGPRAARTSRSRRPPRPRRRSRVGHD
jgi:ParB-like chromosome segregation protein Spo0J